MSTAVAGRVDTSVMPVLHSMFRREFRLAGSLVRGVAEGDLARARVVAAHLDLIDGVLHHHHTVEDELLWPPLLERVPAEMAPIVTLMEAQHATVDRLLAEADPLLALWRSTAAAAERDRLAEVHDELAVHLREHLDAEEDQLLPLVETNLTQAEWDALGEAGRSGIKRTDQTLVLGMYQYDGDPAALARMLSDAPPPVRWLVPRLARRAYRRHARLVHGTPTP